MAIYLLFKPTQWIPYTEIIYLSKIFNSFTTMLLKKNCATSRVSFFVFNFSQWPWPRIAGLWKTIYWRPFVKRFTLSMQYPIGPLSCLCVTLEYYGQTVGWINMKLGLEVGLGPGHIVLDGDPPLRHQRGTDCNFRPTSVVAKRLDGSRYHLVRM